MYYFAHANRHLGARQWDWHLSLGTGAVYYNTDTKIRSYVAYNPLPTPQTVTVSHSGSAARTFVVPARTLACVTDGPSK